MTMAYAFFIRLRMVRAQGVAIAAMALLFACAPAFACSGRIAAGMEAPLDYDPFDPLGAAQSHDVTVENTSGQDCAFQLRFEPEGAPAAFAFAATGESGEQLAGGTAPAGSTDALLTRQLAPGETQSLRYTTNMPAGQMLAPGEYRQPVRLALTAIAGAAPENGAAPSDTASIMMSAYVQDRLGVNIAGAGTMKTLDFRELTAGETMRVVIEARSNRNFTIEAYSRNGGALAMDPPHEEWRIDYRMALNGRTIALPAAIGPFNQTPISGQPFEALFTIGDVESKRAGLYTDEITIEIKPAL
ncbi:MAG: hypothetical protein ACFCUR_00070 [Rhodomicrobiaceae bacterium]